MFQFQLAVDSQGSILLLTPHTSPPPLNNYVKVQSQQVKKNYEQGLKKIDGVGPVDNRPSTDQLHPFVMFLKYFHRIGPLGRFGLVV